MDNFKNYFEQLAVSPKEKLNRTIFMSWSGSDYTNFETLQNYLKQIHFLCSEFSKVNMTRNKSIAIIMKNCVVWEHVEKAALLIGLDVLGIETQSSSQQVEQLLQQFKPSVIVVGSEEAHTFSDVLTADKSVLYISELTIGPRPPFEYVTLPQLSDSELQSYPIPTNFEFEPKTEGRFIVLTSGTTGQRKGLLYTQGQFLMAAKVLGEVYGPFSTEDNNVCWLPLANPFQRIVNLVGLLNNTPTYIVEDPRDLLSRLNIIQPTMLVGVPRVFEKIFSGIHKKLESKSRLLATLLNYYYTPLRHKGLKMIHRPLSKLVFVILKLLVFPKIKILFGTKLKCFVSGSAACPLYLLRFFNDLGLPIYQAYGLSENIVPVAANNKETNKFGSVGKVLRTNKVVIHNDGEVSVSGLGTYNKYIDSNGKIMNRANQTVNTGDLGHFDDDGYLFLDGRRNDIFKTSTGRKVIPSNIEHIFSSFSSIEHSVVIGENKPWLTAIINPSEGTTQEDIIHQVSHLKERLKSNIPLRAILVSTQPFTVGRELTLNMKLRRRYVETKYQSEVETIYESLNNARAEHPQNLPNKAWWVKIS